MIPRRCLCDSFVILRRFPVIPHGSPMSFFVIPERFLYDSAGSPVIPLELPCDSPRLSCDSLGLLM